MLVGLACVSRVFAGGGVGEMTDEADIEEARGSAAVEYGIPERYTNGVGMVMILIPDAQFGMGQGDNPIAPAHQVRITKPFYMALTETTQEQYRRVMGETPSWHTNTGSRVYPVECVTFSDATSFCHVLSGMSGRRYRLPSEAEWELAAGAGMSDAPLAAGGSWNLGNSGRVTHEVGRLAAGPFGLYDMCGNVWEWTVDVVGSYPVGGVAIDPMNTDWQGKTRRKSRILRGGCYGVAEEMCRPWRRVQCFEQFTAAVFIGFRAVMEVGADAAAQ